MSHIVTIKTEMRDPLAIVATCSRFKLEAARRGTTTVGGAQRTGHIIKLTEWLYPIVIDTTTGETHFDNYEGNWGDIKDLNAFRQRYAVEKARIEARKEGYTNLTETVTQNGTIELTINNAR